MSGMSTHRGRRCYDERIKAQITANPEELAA
jgi:hypothetical protein